MKKTLLLAIFSAISFFVKGQNPSELDSIIRIVKTEKDTIKVMSLIRIGKMYNMKGMADSALHYFNLALADAKLYSTNIKICAILLSIAETEGGLAKYDEALEHLFTIMKMAEKGDCGAYGSKAKPVIGFIYIWQKKEKEALRYFLEAETELQKWKDTSGLIAVYANLPVSMALTGDTVKAMQYFKKGFDIVNAFALSSASNERKSFTIQKKLAYTFNFINFLSKNEDLLIPLGEMQLLKKELTENPDPYQQYYLYSLLADIHLRLKQYEQSLSYGEQALELNEDKENYGDLLNLHWTVAKAAAGLKQYDKAYNNIILYTQYNDSVYKLSKLEAINSVEAKYQVEKKEQQILTLNKEKRDQKIIIGSAIGGLLIVLGLLAFVIRSKKLQKKLFNKEKEIQKKELEQKMAELEQTALRAQMNPHFIFNCLNSVNRFILTNDAEGANHYLTTFANLIRQTLENSGKKHIALKDEIKYLETYIKMEQLRSNNKFDHSITISPEVDQSGTYIPNMIVQPYVENSIHHGMLNVHGKKGMIKLDISKGTKLNFVVDDNGEGIKSKNPLQQSGEQHRSMGGALTEKRIEMYNMLNEEKIELEVLDKSDLENQDTGTRVTFKFPLSN